jgi:hypothetical protein
MITARHMFLFESRRRDEIRLDNNSEEEQSGKK